MLSYRIDLRKRLYIKRYIKTNVIYKSKVYSKMYKCNSHYCRRRGCATACYFFRTKLFIEIIKQIDDKFINVKMNFIDDCLLFFLLTRKARSLRQIKRIFYLIVRRPSENNNTKIQFRLNEKKKNTENMRCLAFINFIEFVLIKTKNNIIDKKIPSLEINNFFLKHKCRYNKYIRKRAIKVLKLFLRNEYIEKKIKNDIFSFFNEIKQK